MGKRKSRVIKRDIKLSDKRITLFFELLKYRKRGLTLNEISEKISVNVSTIRNHHALLIDLLKTNSMFMSKLKGKERKKTINFLTSKYQSKKIKERQEKVINALIKNRKTKTIGEIAEMLEEPKEYVKFFNADIVRKLERNPKYMPEIKGTKRGGLINTLKGHTTPLRVRMEQGQIVAMRQSGLFSKDELDILFKTSVYRNKKIKQLFKNKNIKVPKRVNTKKQGSLKRRLRFYYTNLYKNYHPFTLTRILSFVNKDLREENYRFGSQYNSLIIRREILTDLIKRKK